MGVYRDDDLHQCGHDTAEEILISHLIAGETWRWFMICEMRYSALPVVSCRHTPLKHYVLCKMLSYELASWLPRSEAQMNDGLHYVHTEGIERVVASSNVTLWIVVVYNTLYCLGA